MKPHKEIIKEATNGLSDRDDFLYDMVEKALQIQEQEFLKMIEESCDELFVLRNCRKILIDKLKSKIKGEKK